MTPQNLFHAECFLHLRFVSSIFGVSPALLVSDAESGSSLSSFVLWLKVELESWLMVLPSFLVMSNSMALLSPASVFVAVMGVMVVGGAASGVKFPIASSTQTTMKHLCNDLKKTTK